MRKMSFPTASLGVMKKILRFGAFGALSLVISACVSIDSRISREPIDMVATAHLSGSFLNTASYRSTGEFLAVNNLAELLNIPATQAEYVRITGDPSESVTLSWLSEGKELASREYSKEFGLMVARDGLIDLPSKGNWSSGGGAVGYERRSVRLFINANGDLAAVQSGGGGGFFGPFPIGIYAQHLAIFPRSRP